VPFSSQVRLTRGLQAPGVLDLLYADDKWETTPSRAHFHSTWWSAASWLA